MPPLLRQKLFLLMKSVLGRVATTFIMEGRVRPLMKEPYHLVALRKDVPRKSMYDLYPIVWYIKYIFITRSIDGRHGKVYPVGALHAEAHDNYVWEQVDDGPWILSS